MNVSQDSYTFVRRINFPGMELENIVTSIRKYYPVSDEALEVLIGKFQRMEFPKRHLLIREGVFEPNVYFVERGIARAYSILENGKELTTWFSAEGDLVFSSLALYHNKPGTGYAEVLEDSVMYAIPITVLNELYRTQIDIANWGRVIHQECLLNLTLTRNDRLYLPARERYLKLLQQQPDIFRRVKLGHIASFLGMSSQNLSRLRSEFSKK